MTTAPGLLSLRSPSALVAALPYLLGFHPADSAVLVWVSQGRILLTQRMDLPDKPALLPAWVEVAFGHDGARQADSVVVAMVTDDPPVAAVVDALLVRADHAGIEVRDVLHVREDRWRSLLCADPSCCPREGRAVPLSTSDAVAAEFALEGFAPLAARGDVEASFDADEEAVRLVTEVPLPHVHDRDREAWRDARVSQTLSLLVDDPGPSSDARVAALVLSGLADIRVRDTVLWELARWPDATLASALGRLVDLVRAAPAGRVAPVAAVTAVVAWLLGDGARAGISLQRALADDAAYSLAGLLAASLQAGLAPGHWRASMAELTRDECRHGARPARGGRPGEPSVG